MSCRAMYYKLRPTKLGRDKFERLCGELGLLSKRKKESERC